MTFRSSSRTLCLLFVLSSSAIRARAVGDDLSLMLRYMESKTLKWARKQEELVLPANRCDGTTTLVECSKASHNGCVSEFPYATCPGAEHRLLRCGGGDGEEGGCSGLFDFTASRVSLSTAAAVESFRDPIRDPNDREKDGVCSTLPGDEFVVDAREEQSFYWSDFGVSSPTYFYGNDDGVFRILPGNPEVCDVDGQSSYDPRVRPWYVAASSGPKDVVLVLDVSGSMSNYGRLDIMREAAARVINTLGAGDFVSVVVFNDHASHLDGGSGGVGNGRTLRRADAAHKNDVLGKLKTLEAGGGTNFYSAFDLAFDTFRDSDRQELSSGCHRAVLFLTDGKNQDPTDDLLTMIQSNMDSFDDEDDGSVGRPAIFAYSFGSGADEEVPKRIACENGGIWASIGDGGDLAASMGAYYKYFAYGLSGRENENFVAWVEPYVYSTTGELGTTASAPVYDRSVDPPVLAGVVGLDFSFAAMERALGDEGARSRDAVLRKIVDRSVATCPRLNLDPCRLESLREYGSGDEPNAAARCAGSEHESCLTKPLKTPLCDESRYPTNVWNNDHNRDRTFEEKACCTVGEKPRVAGALSDNDIKELVCVGNDDDRSGERSSLFTALFVGIGAAAMIVVLSLSIVFVMRRRKMSPRRKHEQQRPVTTPIESLGSDVVVLPVPTAPPPE